MRFVVDVNLGEPLANGMKAFGENVSHIKEMFFPDTEDPVWLKYIGDNNIFVITRDEKLRWRPAEIQSIRRYNVGAFFLGGKNRSRCDLIRQLVRSWPHIKELASREKTPFIYRVPPQGSAIRRVPF